MRLRNAIAGFGASLLSAALLSSGSAVAQGAGQPDRVPLIMTKLPPSGSAKYKAIISKAGKASGQVLTLTKTEMWEVPKENVEAVKKAAAEHGAAATQVGADYNEMFHPAPADMRMSPKQSGMMEMAKASKSTMGVGMMATPMAPMVEYALTKDAGPNIVGPPPPGRRPRSRSSSATRPSSRSCAPTSTSSQDMCIWRGAVEGTDAPATIMWWPGGKMAGTVQHQGRIYSIRHMGGDDACRGRDGRGQDAPGACADARAHARQRSQPARRSRSSTRATPASAARDAGHAAAEALQDGKKKGKKSRRRQGRARSQRPRKGKAGRERPRDVVIDVIVAYTKKAAAPLRRRQARAGRPLHRGGQRVLPHEQLGHVKLRLVHAYQTDYVEEGAHFDHVWRFADKGDGYMEEIHGLRDKHRADVALLIVDDAKGCGLATRVYADADEAFAVVHHECAATSYTVAHEIGHLIGARHDLALDKNMNPFPYGHGYVNGTKWRDIMSYKDSCGGCPRIPVWSSPHGHGQGRAGRHARPRQRPRHRRAGRARRRLPLTRRQRGRARQGRGLCNSQRSRLRTPPPHKQELPPVRRPRCAGRVGGN